MTGIRKRSNQPRVDQAKTRYGTTFEQEVRDSNRLMQPAIDAIKKYTPLGRSMNKVNKTLKKRNK